MKPLILVLGSNGQLGTAFLAIKQKYLDSFDFLFCTKREVNILERGSIEKIFQQYTIAHCINCTAYTKVDEAEKAENQHFNWAVNAEAVGFLAILCQKYGVSLIHFSTDYVFDGFARTPYTEADITNPQNEYGRAKLEGERLCMLHCTKALVFRTSWVYAPTGHNFVRTMLKLFETKTRLSVVADQLGTPTYALDIAHMVIEAIKRGETQNAAGQIVHFTNEGIASWYDFATAIKQITKSAIDIQPIRSEEYVTPAKRPLYSVLSKQKYQTYFSVPLQDWQESVETCIKMIRSGE